MVGPQGKEKFFHYYRFLRNWPVFTICLELTLFETQRKFRPGWTES